MNIVDGVIVLILLASTILGYLRGFVKQLVSLFGWVAAYLAAYLFYDDVAPLLRDYLPLTDNALFAEYGVLAAGLELDRYMYNAMAFALLFFGGKLLITLAGYFLHSAASLPVLKMFNQWSGALLGLVQALVVTVIAIMVMDALPYARMQDMLGQSSIFHWMELNRPAVTEYLLNMWT